MSRETQPQLPLDTVSPSLSRAADHTQALLRAIAGDRVHAGDREVIVAAIVAEAATSDGIVDPNKVRDRLRDPHSGQLTVYPRLVGPVYNALARAGFLHPHGWTISDDLAGGNVGKRARLWRLASTGAEPAAAAPSDPPLPPRVHPPGCVDGWLGDVDAPHPCPVCRPHRYARQRQGRY